MGCSSCGGRSTSYVVKIPGQPDRNVSTEAAAKALVSGVAGASYSGVKQ